jgi:Rod binding domain-containing protein
MELTHNLGRVSMSSPIANPNRGINIQTQQSKSLDHRSINDRKYIPKQFQDVAESMEAQFAEAMLNQMNQTIDETPSEESGMDYYKSLQTSERAKMMAKQNNLGLQNMILDQIYPKRMRNEMALKQYETQSNLIHQNLPRYKLAEKNDNIEMGRNDSIPMPGDKIITSQNKEGGLQ